jgi:hypothetical protein
MGLNLGTVPGLDKIAIPRPNVQFPNADGLQGAHIYGKEFTSRALGTLLDLIDPNRSQSNPDSKANGFLAPETKAGGMATGVAVHRGEKQKACDTVRLIRRSPNALAA